MPTDNLPFDFIVIRVHANIRRERRMKRTNDDNRRNGISVWRTTKGDKLCTMRARGAQAERGLWESKVVTLAWLPLNGTCKHLSKGVVQCISQCIITACAIVDVNSILPSLSSNVVQHTYQCLFKHSTHLPNYYHKCSHLGRGMADGCKRLLPLTIIILTQERLICVLLLPGTNYAA